ncbi:MAG: hypothetical protein MUP66_01610 [Candidatus Nanohaloarchaeota archaeon QJJ-5]|nr:hypothetical protein [Candidatus Nanohaloarchaeota archaeon QJJ-5]
MAVDDPGWRDILDRIDAPETSVNKVSYTIKAYDIPVRRLDSSSVTLQGLHNAVADGEYTVEGDEELLRKDTEQQMREQIETVVEDLFGTHKAALINEEPYEDILDTVPSVYHGESHDGEPRPVVLLKFENDPLLYRHELHPITDDTLDAFEESAQQYNVKLGRLRDQLDVHSIRNDLIIPSQSPSLPEKLGETRGTGTSMFFGDTRYLEQDIVPEQDAADLYHQVLPQDEGYQVSLDLPASEDVDLELGTDGLSVFDEDGYQGTVSLPEDVGPEWSYETATNNGVYTIDLQP